MIYYWRGEQYEDAIDKHNDSVLMILSDDSDDGSSSGSDSSLEGRNKFIPTRYSAAGLRAKKKYRRM